MKELNNITKKYDIKWTQAIADELIAKSKIKGFLTTQELEMTFALLINMMKSELK